MSDIEENHEDRPRIPHVFVNYVNTYSASAIAKCFSTSAPGIASLEPEEEEEALENAKNNKANFIVSGTLLEIEGEEPREPDFYCRIVKNDVASVQAAIMAADVIVYSIAEGEHTAEAMAALEFIQQEAQHFTGPKTFVLTSSCMTWLETKHLDPDDPEIPFTEDDYRKRRTSPKFKDHIALEKLAIKMGNQLKKYLTCYVICAGICYGDGESLLHWMFKAAWSGDESLPIYGSGYGQVVPMIHVRDLASTVLYTVDLMPKTKYILAVDQSHSSVRDIVKRVSSTLTTGRTNVVPKADAQATNDISQLALDALSCNLMIEGGTVRNDFTFRWVCEDGLVEMVEDIVMEYKKSRGLLPIRIIVLGPPGVGKTSVATELAAHYKIHHIHVKAVIEDSFKNLEQLVAKGDAPAEDDEEEEEVQEKASEAEATLSQLKESMAANDGRIEESLIIDLLKQKLESKPVLNKGYVLDGYPKTYAQSKTIFEEMDEEGEPQGKPAANKVPEMIVDLSATNDFLKERMMNLPEEIVQGTHNNEEGYLRRYAQFQADRAEEDTVIHWFSEMEIDPVIADITQKNDEENTPIIEAIKKAVGPPRHYGLTPEEKEELARSQLADRQARQAIARALKAKKETAEAKARKANIGLWTHQLEEVRRQERQILEEKARPFRQYVATHVMPTLTSGLIECAKVKPADPVDFLAEYLYQHNPALQ
ncbi:unnamed protein product [Oikopleura dioica]|uniref:ATPase AAA-type core domain-containing protein n=1 Tax=Oikopleura dioica TaxID=34765 RepID=E4XIP4_OIKDI|nr:unnamed protein product [Oikopleura dioica]